jgi:hypothetical protein
MKLSVGVAQAIAQAAGANGGLTLLQAQNMARAAIYFMNQHMTRLGKPAPATKRNGIIRYLKGPPVRGRYPFKRTGMLQANITIEDLNLKRIMREATIRVGIRKNAFYGAVLEARYGALGLKDTLKDILPQLQAQAGVPLQFQMLDVFLPEAPQP